MKKDELIATMSALPNDLELVTGDGDTGRFLEPCVAYPAPFKTLWLLGIYNPLEGRWYKDYFHSEEVANDERQHALGHGWEPKKIVPVQCLNITG